MSQYRFYHYYHYPLPPSDKLAWFDTTIDIGTSHIPNLETTTAHQIPTKDSLQTIAQRGKYIPCIQEIYISGPKTWGSAAGDIGLCIVVQTHTLRTVYMILSCVVWIYQVYDNKVNIKIHALVDQNKMSFYELSYKAIDPYLVYRIAHLSLIYSDHNQQSQTIYSSNYRINHILPSYDFKQQIYILDQLYCGSSTAKRITSHIAQTIIGHAIESFLKCIIHPLLIRRYRHDKKSMPLITDSIIANWPIERFETYLAYKHRNHHKT